MLLRVFICFIAGAIPFLVYGLADYQKKTEAKEYGRCPYCDYNALYIEDRTINTNLDALSMLHQAMDEEGLKKPSSSSPTKGLR